MHRKYRPRYRHKYVHTETYIPEQIHTHRHMPKDLSTDIQRHMHTKTYLHTLTDYIYRDAYLQRSGNTQKCTDMYAQRPVQRHIQLWVHTEVCAYNDICAQRCVHMQTCQQTQQHRSAPEDVGISAGDVPELGSAVWVRGVNELFNHAESPLQNPCQSSSSCSYF